MKSLLSLVLCVSFSSALASDYQAVPLKSVEVVSCVNGSETLTIQLLTDARANDNKVLATFVDYKKNGETVYSSSSFNAPKLIPVGAGVYEVQGNGTESGKKITYGLDYMNLKASMDGVFTFEGCKFTR